MTNYIESVSFLLFCIIIVQTQTQIISVIKTASGDFQVENYIILNKKQNVIRQVHTDFFLEIRVEMARNAFEREEERNLCFRLK